MAFSFVIVLFHFHLKVCKFGSALTLTFSDSFFDSALEPTFLISNITEWRKDIPTPTVFVPEFPFSSDLPDMTHADFFDAKDSASDCSMDSAYQSQSGASRRGTRKPSGEAQLSHAQKGTHFNGGEIYSPSLSSNSYNPFPDQGLDFNQLQQSAVTEAWGTPEQAVMFANYSAGQDFVPQVPSNVLQLSHSSAMNVSSPWTTTDAHYQSSPFTYASYVANSKSNNVTFDTSNLNYRQWSDRSFEGLDQLSAVRRSSSFTAQQDSRRASAPDSNFGAFVATPTSATSIHFSKDTDFDQPATVDSR